MPEEDAINESLISASPASLKYPLVATNDAQLPVPRTTRQAHDVLLCNRHRQDRPGYGAG